MAAWRSCTILGCQALDFCYMFKPLNRLFCYLQPKIFLIETSIRAQREFFVLFCFLIGAYSFYLLLHNKLFQNVWLNTTILLFLLALWVRNSGSVSRATSLLHVALTEVTAWYSAAGRAGLEGLRELHPDALARSL